MKKLLVISLSFHSFLFMAAQEIPQTTQEQLENLTDAQQTEIKDDSYLQELEHFKKHPVNLNKADADEMKTLIFLNDLQIDNLISYRNLLGKLISIYELQSIPAWDIATIKKILPYVTVNSTESVIEDFGKRLKGGDQSLLVRFSEILEKSKGFDNTVPGTKYLGGRERFFFRYHYRFRNLLQYGITGDKDAGEQFFRRSEKFGFDFYSFHLFARKIGRIQAIALGDFTVNMGQGLIQWQSLAFTKSADVMDVKRESAILRPYTTSGEFYFHRGGGITVRFGHIEGTAFASVRKLSANFVADTVNSQDFISSFLNSGYHRTQSEIDDKNNLRQISFGGNLSYYGKNWKMGVNGIGYDFSLPVVKRNEPYNLFAIGGKKWNNFSIDYSYTYHNLHFFGEAAIDKNFNKGIINGLLMSVDPKVDLCVVQRAIGKRYQAVYGNAFTENTYPTNENAIYAGVSLRPLAGWRLDMYADLYRFPWLKYLVDAPSYGKDFLTQLTFSPGKLLEIYCRFRNETKQTNQPGNTTVTNYLTSIPKQSLRTEIIYHVNSAVTLRERIELLWYDEKGMNKENGFLGFFDFVFKPLLRAYSGNIRLQYFETDGYNSRIYSYENDVLYSFSIPAFFEKGYRYYINVDYNLKRNLAIWLRWSQTIYTDETSIGSGLDEIPKNHRSELKAEARLLF
jgi:hypothetical protein